jgi:nucleoprotein TPR
MAKTRSSRGTGDGEGDGSVPQTGSTKLTLELPAVISQETLASLLPDISLTEPSEEDVISLYKLILGQFEDVNNLSAQVNGAQVASEEMEQSLHEHDVRRKELEDALGAKTEELEKMKEERNALGTFSCHHMNFANL